MAAAKTYKLGEAITGLKYDVKNDLSIVGIDLPVPPIKAGDKGEKVTALQAALVKLHRMAAAQETGTFDAETGKALGAFMHDWGFKATEGYDATVRLAMAHALNGEKPGQNVHEVPPVDPPPAKAGPKDDNTVRGKIVANALWGIANTAQIHYEETRPIPDLNSPRHLPLTTDCSGFATLCYKWAGAPDPNGNGYSGQGYTGTMLAHMKHIPKPQVQKGDLVVFGGGTGHHVCIVLEPGNNPMLASHGGESGPLKISLNDEYAWQSKNGGDGITWLTVLDGSGAVTKPLPSSHPSGGKAPSKPVKPAPSKPRPPVAGEPSAKNWGAKLVAAAEAYKGDNEAWLQSHNKTGACPDGESCANFVSSMLMQIGYLKIKDPILSVDALSDSLQQKGWTKQTDMSKAKPGDVWCVDDRTLKNPQGENHTEIIKGFDGKQLILVGSNNVSESMQVISDDSYSGEDSALWNKWFMQWPAGS